MERNKNVTVIFADIRTSNYLLFAAFCKVLLTGLVLKIFKNCKKIAKKLN